MPRELTAENVAQALAELGSTEKEVAASLDRLKIKGRRQSTCGCPIAKYVQGKFARPNTFVSFSSTRVYKNGELTVASAAVVTVVNSAHVGDFIRAFGDGKYSELLER